MLNEKSFLEVKLMFRKYALPTGINILKIISDEIKTFQLNLGFIAYYCIKNYTLIKKQYIRIYKN